jgi:hypothetical protein
LETVEDGGGVESDDGAGVAGDVTLACCKHKYTCV